MNETKKNPAKQKNQRNEKQSEATKTKQQENATDLPFEM